jgi:RNA polymerase sigma factor (sigma-70 family)
VQNHNQHHELVRACISNDRKAQFELYGLYSKAMYNICLRMVNDRDEAEDVMQNSFLDVFTKLNTFRFESSVGSWIKRIVINNCINLIRKNKLAIVELEKQGIENLALQDDDTHTPLNLDVNKLHHAISLLPDGYRIVFTLYAMEGYDHEEIGNILGINEATSKSQYSRAKQKLRDILVHPSRLLN